MLHTVLTRGLLSPDRPASYLRYALIGHHFVDGWLRQLGIVLVDAADAVQREFAVRGHVAEIGVHHGRLLVLLSLLRRPAEQAVAVDVFADQHLNVDRSGRGDRGKLEANLRRWDPRSEDVHVVQVDSWTLDGKGLADLAGGPLRLVSVDGGHTAALTLHDLTTAADSLIDGGIIILDDCFNELFPAVSEGAQKFLRARPEFYPLIAAGNKTLICQQTHAQRYRTRFREIFRERPSVPWVLHENDFMDRPMMSVRWLEARWATYFWLRYTKGRLKGLPLQLTRPSRTSGAPGQQSANPIEKLRR